MSDDLRTTAASKPLPLRTPDELRLTGVLKSFGSGTGTTIGAAETNHREVATEVCQPENATAKRTLEFDHKSKFPDTAALQQHLKDKGFQDGQLVKVVAPFETITKPLHLKACAVNPEGKIHLFMGNTIRIPGEHGRITITAA